MARHYKSFIDLTGRSFGRWIVLSYSHSKSGVLYWHCRCTCGVEKTVVAQSLKNSRSKSCGCLSNELASVRETTHGLSKGEKAAAGYHCWAQMKSRCSHPRANGFSRYGGRGITVCNAWFNSFETFISDMGPRPSTQHSIERIDVNGNYEPSNCRWATTREQNRNKRTNAMFFCNGKTMCLADWAEELKTDAGTIKQRIALGWKHNDVFTKKVNHKSKKVLFNGKQQTILEWSIELSIGYGTIKSRLNRGWSIERALSTPVN